MNTTCLTYQQLEKYSTNTILKNERENIYNHLLSCELCTCAVNGFTEMPFAIDELVAINNNIDTKAKVNSLTASQVFIVVFSILSIAGFYLFSNSFASNKIITETDTKEFSLETQIVTIIENTINSEYSKNTLLKKENNKKEVIEKFDIPQNIEPIKDILLNSETANANSEKLKNIKNNSDVYIHNFKIVNYRTLYFHKNKTNNPLGGLPTFVENEKMVFDINDSDESQTISAVSILENGLQQLNNNKYEKAVVNFNTLLKFNLNDFNALFYGGLCYAYLNKNEKAISYFEQITKNNSQEFNEETKWNLALCYIKINDTEKAKAILKEIELANGFYSKKAKEKLKEI